MNDIFWLENPKILFHKKHMLEFWPYESMSYNQKLNATTRFLILVSLLGYMTLNNYLVLLFGVILILLIVFIHNYYKREGKESMMNMKELREEDNEKLTSHNPLYNVLLTDYTDNVDKKPARKHYDEKTEEHINNQVKNFVLENNKDNKDIGKIFNNVVNNLDFEKSMRQFHMNPSTTIPNSQDDFLKYCYNDLYSEKPLLIY